MTQKNKIPHMSYRTLLSCALASCLAASMPLAFAQSTAATIRGQVLVDSTPANDAQVTATNVATGLSRTVRATANGSYSVAGLPPGTYRVDVTAAGQTSSQTATVLVGQTATLDIGLGGVAEAAAPGDATTLDTVTVTAPVLAETKTSEVANYVSAKTIQAVPQLSRNFLSFAETVPGVSFQTAGDGSTQLRSGSQSANGVNVFIDGVGQKNYVLKGGISGQDSSRGNPFPQLAIAEYKVITSNYKAEYDQLSSAAITSVTRSGTNEFEGEVFVDYTYDGWRSKTAEEEASGVKAESKENQYGAAFGGPIVRDLLQFFVTYEGKEFENPREIRVGTRIGGVPVAPGDIPLDLIDQIAPTTAPFKEDLFFGKLSWLPGEASIVELSVKYRDESELTEIGNGANLPSFGTDKTNDELRSDLRWQYTGESWLNDAHLTYEDASYSPRPINPVPGIRLQDVRQNPIGGRIDSLILNAGGGENFQDKGQQGYGLQNDFTFSGWEGHTLKAGVKFKSVEVNSFEQIPFNPQLYYDLYENLALGNLTTDQFLPYRVQFGALLPGVPDRDITSKNKQYGIYIQDDWEVSEQLTLNFGIRYDYEESPAYLDYVTRPDVAAALRNWTNLDNADYNVEDYISGGNNRDAFKDGWQPRLGFSYDLSGDERHVIFGGAGRSYDRNLFDYIALEQSKSTFPRYEFFFNTPDNPCTVGVGNCYTYDERFMDQEFLTSLAAQNPNLGAEIWIINNDLKTPYSDQFSLGMRNALGDWNTSVTLVHVMSHDGIIRSLGNRRPDGSFFPPGVSFGSAPFDFRLPGYGSVIKTDNGVESRLNSVLVGVDKPFTSESGWGVTFAYTYSDAKENRPRAADADESFIFDVPDLENQPFVQSVNIPRHRLVTTGIYDAGWGVTLSGKVTLASRFTEEQSFFNPDGSGQYGSVEPPGTFGQRQVDLAVEKVWDTGSDIELRVRADVLNVFNHYNYTDYITAFNDPRFGQRANNITLFPPRTFKLTMGFRW